MAKGSKGRIERKTPDLGIYPDELPYEPPPAHATRSHDWEMILSETARVHVRISQYKSFVVEFSINQLHISEDGTTREVARIDTSGGTIHRHQFIQSTGEDVYDHRLIARIPRDEGWQVVHDGYGKAIDTMMDEFEENERRWRHG